MAGDWSWPLTVICTVIATPWGAGTAKWIAIGLDWMTPFSSGTLPGANAMQHPVTLPFPTQECA